MTWFPQVGAGSIAQLPLRRKRRWRVISNQLESDERIVLPDTMAGEISWGLSFQELTDGEAQRMSDLFLASDGQFGSFLFVDPLANLLGWSEDFARPDWQRGLLGISGGVSDPLGSHRAWSLQNFSEGIQRLQQTRALPGEYVTCFSVWLRSNTPCTATLQRDGNQTAALTGPAWKRFYVNGAGAAGVMQATFSIAVPAGQTIEAWGPQVEAQPWPSPYKPTTVAAGIYEDTHFGTDELKMTSTGPGLSSCGIVLTSRI